MLGSNREAASTRWLDIHVEAKPEGGVSKIQLRCRICGNEQTADIDPQYEMAGAVAMKFNHTDECVVPSRLRAAAGALLN